MKRLANSAKDVELLLSKIDESVDDCMRQFTRIRNVSVRADTDGLRDSFMSLKRYWVDEYQTFQEMEIQIQEAENVQRLSMFRLKPLALCEFNETMAGICGQLDKFGPVEERTNSKPEV